MVTGATGFLGAEVLRLLRARDLPVVAQGRDPEKCADLAAEGHPVLRWDLATPLPEQVPAELAEVTSVLHCAALSAPFGPRADFERANVTGTRNLLRFARSQGVQRFVLISSPSVYFAMQDQLGVSEDMPLPRPFNPYAASKRAAEQLVLAHADLGPVVLRPRGIYGAGDSALLPRLLAAARSRPLPLLRGGQARIDLTHVSDAAGAALAALLADQSAEGEIFNISGGEVLPVTEIAGQACTRAGVALRWRSLPLRPLMAMAALAEGIARYSPGQPEPLVTRYGLALFAYAQSLNIDKARRVLGWSPQVRFAEGLDMTFAKGAP
nr:NAD(P)-dependent oxidoreductase [Phaeobacter sp. HF9A]